MAINLPPRRRRSLLVLLSFCIIGGDQDQRRTLKIMDHVIRPLTTADEPILWEMLYQALHTSEGAPSRDIVHQPEYARHVKGWGRAGDTGFVAYDAEQRDELLGAVWLRFPTSEQKEGEQAAPELAFAVKQGQRKRGIGAALLTQLVKANPQHSAVSISAPANNPAVRLYERFGFKIVQQSPGAVSMRRDIP
jgi:ribosomal protein S18 acetylase RimI-like enzyme